MIAKWILVAWTLLLIGPVPGTAQTAKATATATECPDTAEQALYNMWARVHAGQESNPDSIYRIAKSTIDYCQDRSDAQGLAIELLLILGSGLEKPEEKLLVYSDALMAVSHNDTAWRRDVTPEIISISGTPEKLYFYGKVNDHHQNRIVPALMTLAAQGHVADIFTAPALTDCPYLQTDQERALKEAEGLRVFADMAQIEVANLIAYRMRSLADACPLRRSQILDMLGRFYAQGYARVHPTHAELGQSYLELTIATHEEILALPNRADDRGREEILAAVALRLAAHKAKLR